MLSVTPISSAKEREQFIRFPWKLYKGDKQWVPPVIAEQRRELDPVKGTFFDESKAELFLASRDGELVGRIAAIRNERHLAEHNDSVGFFGFFECIDDVTVANALLTAAEDWLFEEGLSVARGPTSFTVYDPAGVTVKGHEMRPGVGMAYTPTYYQRLLEQCGYNKVRDLHAYHIERDQANLTLLNYENYAPNVNIDAITIRNIDLKQLDREAKIFAHIFTTAWKKNWGAIPLKPEDFLHAAKEMGPFLDERLGYVAEFEGTPIGIFLAMPDPWEILHHADGKIGLATLFKILTRKNKIGHYRVFMMGILPEYRMGPVAPLMIQRFYHHWKDFPYMKTVEFSWILEDNTATLELLEHCGARALQTFRVYDKFI